MYSDFIFGMSITPDLFAEFSGLTSVNIGWCRVNLIHDHAFDGNPYLTELTLDGNPLRPRRFELYSLKKRFESNINQLSIRRASLESDESLFSDSVPGWLHYPKIETIDLSFNFLYRMPIIVPDPRYYCYDNPHNIQGIQKLILDNNYLENLYPSGDSTPDPIWHCKCKIFFNLTTVSIQNNKLKSVLGLCPNFTHLYLANNRLYEQWSFLNSEVLKSLSKLEVLDLSQNGLTALDDDLLQNMTRLKEIYLVNNNITRIPLDFFSRNSRLEKIYLRSNNITSVEWDLSLLPYLKVLDLSGNSLTTLSTEFVGQIQASKLEVLYLTGNKFSCLCNDNSLPSLVSRIEIVKSVLSITCSEPVHQEQVVIYNYRQSNWQCKIKYPLIYTLISFGACLVSACFEIPCYNYWWYIRHIRVVGRAIAGHMKRMKYDKKCLYDAYVSYDRENQTDSQWIKDILVPAVEGKDDSTSAEEVNNGVLTARESL